MCCCCPPAISALFCLWVQSGFSKGTVAGALTFFPPDPPLYKFERRDKNDNQIPDDKESGEEEDKKTDQSSPTSNQHDGELRDGTYHPNEGESREKMKSPAQQLTDRAKELRKQAKKRNTRDARDAKNDVKYKFILDPRISSPRFRGGVVEATKIRTKTGAYVAAVIYKIPAEAQNENTKTIIYSHGNATDVGAMYPLQSILSHSLECNVVSYDYSGYGESGGIPMESNTYKDIHAVFKYTVENICGGDASKVILYGQSVGSGPCCYLGCREKGMGGIVLHSPFMSGMRVLTPSR
jgi:acetyl esterase/lipase